MGVQLTERGTRRARPQTASHASQLQLGLLTAGTQDVTDLEQYPRDCDTAT